MFVDFWFCFVAVVLTSLGNVASLVVLAGEHSYSHILDQWMVHLRLGESVLLNHTHSYGRDVHGEVKKEGDTSLTS